MYSAYGPTNLPHWIVNYMRFRKFIFLVFLFLPTISYAADKNKIVWQQLSPGLEYTRTTPQAANPWGNLHVFRFDLKKFTLHVALAKNFHQLTAKIKHFVEKSQALLGTNGGFFTTDFKPIGLRINNGEIINNLRKISWSGIFYVTSRPQQARIVSFRDFKIQPKINFAIQSGPRLIIDNQIPTLKPGIAARTALGITQDGKIILAVTEHAPMSTYQLAQLLQRKERQGGFNCKNALNLDGGSSTQLYAHLANFSLTVPSFANITDAVLITKI